jgi:tetratricopeptide (TPR) repeat protein
MMDRKETRDVLQWEAVEEATELLQERLFPQAMIELRRVIMANPNNPYAYFYLGVAFFETEQMEAARDAYRAAVTLSPDYLGARVSLSHVLRELGDATAAVGQAKEALRRYPDDGDAMHALGLAEAAKGNRREAKKHLTGFLAKKPEIEPANEVKQILEMLGMGEEGDPVEFK